MRSEFEGKVVVITGAGSGIGRATALAFAGLGAQIVAASRRVTDGESLVEEIAAMACWLASEDCSFTTGGVFDISGGRATY